MHHIASVDIERGHRNLGTDLYIPICTCGWTGVCGADYHRAKQDAERHSTEYVNAPFSPLIAGGFTATDRMEEADRKFRRKFNIPEREHRSRDEEQSFRNLHGLA